MSITLCTSCLPEDPAREVLTVPVILPCSSCGRWDNPRRGIKLFAYRSDPRKLELQVEPFIQLRWAQSEGPAPQSLVLQSRHRIGQLSPGGALVAVQWSEWQDVMISAPLPFTPTRAASAACWCSACDLQDNPIPTRMSICPTCGSKRCARAAHHDNQCTGEPHG